MTPRPLPLLAAGVALAVVAAAGVVGNRRERALEISPVATVENGGPRGLAAARAWLAATGRRHRVLRMASDVPALGEVLLLVAPPSQLDAPAASALLSHAERGGLVVWAMGHGPQPALEERLGVVRANASSDATGRDVAALAPHPLFDGIVLRTGGASLRATVAGWLPVAGEGDRVTALALPHGASEVVVLAGADAFENFRLAEGGNLAFLSRLAMSGPIAFDERHLLAPNARPPPSGRALALILGQALLAAALLVTALGRRLGAVRLPAEQAGGRSARDYLASLADLYRRAGGERELRASTWRSLRRELERHTGIRASASDEEAERRLAARWPRAAEPFSRALKARLGPPGERTLLALLRASAEAEQALARPPIGARAGAR
jgi:hypothetical protein